MYNESETWSIIQVHVHYMDLLQISLWFFFMPYYKAFIHCAKSIFNAPRLKSPVFRDTDNWKKVTEFGKKMEKHRISGKIWFLIPKISKHRKYSKKPHKNKVKNPIKTKQKPIKQNSASTKNLNQTCSQCLYMLQLPCVFNTVQWVHCIWCIVAKAM